MVSDSEKPDSSLRDSDCTLSSHNSHSVGHSGSSRQQKSDGEDASGDDGPSPVGFWDQRLNKVRLQVFGLWARTSKWSSKHCAHKHPY